MLFLAFACPVVAATQHNPELDNHFVMPQSKSGRLPFPRRSCREDCNGLAGHLLSLCASQGSNPLAPQECSRGFSGLRSARSHQCRVSLRKLGLCHHAFASPSPADSRHGDFLDKTLESPEDANLLQTTHVNCYKYEAEAGPSARASAVAGRLHHSYGAAGAESRKCRSYSRHRNINQEAQASGDGSKQINF